MLTNETNKPNAIHNIENKRRRGPKGPGCLSCAQNSAISHKAIRHLGHLKQPSTGLNSRQDIIRIEPCATH